MFQNINWETLSALKEVTIPTWLLVVVTILALKGLFR
jgi:hypothetical protein